MTQATVATEIDTIHTWAQSQGARGIAAVFEREYATGTVSAFTMRRARAVMTADHAGLVIPQAPAEPAPVADERDKMDPSGLWPGVYTVEDEVGHVTFRVEVQPLDAEFAPGKMVLKYMFGRDNHSDYKGMAFVNPGNKLVIWKKFRDNQRLVAAANKLAADPYGPDVMWAKFCARCGDLLSNPESIARGFGPVCAGKGWK